MYVILPLTKGHLSNKDRIVCQKDVLSRGGRLYPEKFMIATVSDCVMDASNGIPPPPIYPQPTSLPRDGIHIDIKTGETTNFLLCQLIRVGFGDP